MTSTSKLIFNKTSLSASKVIIRNSPTNLSKAYHTFTLRNPSDPHLSLTRGKTVYRNRGITAVCVNQRNLTCWKCETELGKNSPYALLVCSKCDSLQKLRGTNIPNYYELLAHAKSYRVELGSLSSRVKYLQKKLHPDLYTQKGKAKSSFPALSFFQRLTFQPGQGKPDEQELSQELSSLVNKAFWTLSHPIERGRYLLKLHGVDDPEGDSEKELTNDPEFLEEVMDLNEQLVEISSEKDWMKFRNKNDETLKELAIKLEDAFDKERIQDAKILIGRMKYYDTLQGKLKDVRSRLGIVE